MNLDEAQEITGQGMGVDRSTWNQAQQTALWLLDRGEGRPTGELIDWDEPDDEKEPAAEDVDVSGRFGCDQGAYFVEANTGPGGPR